VAAQDDWLRRAELAVSKGEDELAKEALKRRKSYQVTQFCVGQRRGHHRAICLRPATLSAYCTEVSLAAHSLRPVLLATHGQEQADTLKAQVDQLGGASQDVLNNTRALEAKLSEARSKKETLKVGRMLSARLRAALARAG
jgi:phage shock protein A